MKQLYKPYIKLILIVAAGLFALAFLINEYAKRYINVKLKKALVNNDSVAYLIGYQNLSVNVWTGYAGVEDFYLRAKEKYEHPPLNTIQLKTPSIHISGINLLKILFSNSLEVGTIYFDSPSITINNVDSTEERDQSKLPFNLYDLIKKEFSSLHVEALIIKNGNIKLIGRDSANLLILLPKVNLKLTDIGADSALTSAKSFLTFSQASLTINNLSGRFLNGLYDFSVPEFNFESRNSSLRIDSFLIQPTLDKKVFAKKVGLQTDCIQLLLTNLVVQFSNVHDLILHQKIFINKMDIESLSLYDYWDKNFPRSQVRQALPKTVLASLPYEIDIREITLKSADILYEELAKGSTETGSISFTKVNGRIRNISNINMKDTIRIHCSGYLMNKALLTADILLPLSQDRFIASMKMESFEMNILNGMIKNFVPVKIKAGVAKSISMYCDANDHSGIGTMTFKYSGLEVEVLSQDKAIDKFIMTRVKNFIANEIVLEKDNPRKGVLRIGKIDYKRDKERNIINYSWNLAFSGIKSSIGLTGQKRKKLF
jgi:hypothetical protein